jgi:hypothetical protein
MGDPKELRARATRLFALVLTAREQGMEAYAKAMDELANEALSEAEEMERRDGE